MPAALEATDVAVQVRATTGWRAIVRGVSLSLRQGQVTALVGETGSGKTLTALSLIRLLPPTARLAGGRIVLGGQDVTVLPERAMTKVRGRRISMIFQDPLTALNPVRRIGYQITEPLVVHQGIGRRKAMVRAGELLEQVGLPNVGYNLQRYPHELSGGMRQRVLIALALSCDPDVLLADEPTTAVDVTTQAQILQLLRELVDRRGLAVLLVTHDLGAAALVADDIDVMYAGTIVEAGRVTDVLQNPNHPYTRGLVACVPRLDVRVRPLPTLPGSVQGVWEIPAGCRFAPRCASAVEKCRQLEPRLQDIGADRASACWVFADPRAMERQ